MLSGIFKGTVSTFPAYFPGYHILYHHNQGVVERKAYRLLAIIFSEGEQMSI